jgi:calnexin
LIQPSKLKAPFLEQFTDDWEKRWKPSHAKKDVQGDEEWAYVGEWAVEEPTVYKGMEGDKGLVIKNPAAHHAISAKFPKKIDPKGKALVVQYEVKLQSKFSRVSVSPRVIALTHALQMASSAVVPT